MSLILVGILGRLFLKSYVGIPNFEIITALTLVSAVFLGRFWAIIVPLSIIAITDVIIGNNAIMLFTWSAFAIIGAIGVLYKNARSQLLSSNFEIIGLTGAGILSSVFFFIYTNFGWWLVSEMYPHTWEGLIQCYAMGLPFFKNNLIGNLVFVPMFSAAAMFIKYSFKNRICNQEKIVIFHKS